MTPQELINEVRRADERVKQCEGVLACERVKRQDLLEALSKAIGTDVTNLLFTYWENGEV